ncbi:MarR family winged helix-turn-helix transcriptional regulator [Chloroflexota bacterium]
MGKYEDEEYSSTELSPQQFAVLTAIKNIEKPVSQKEVADWLDRNTNSITVILNRMAKDGLVERVKDLKDGRANRLVITPRGEKLYDQGREIAARIIDRMTSGLSEREIRSFIRVMGKIEDRTFILRRLTAKAKLVDSVFGETQPILDYKDAELP